MRQYDVFPNPVARLAKQRPYLVVLQHDRVDDIRTVIVAPCAPIGGRSPSPFVSAIVSIDGLEHILLVSELAPIDRNLLNGLPAANVDQESDRIQRAIDFLFTGV